MPELVVALKFSFFKADNFWINCAFLRKFGFRIINIFKIVNSFLGLQTSFSQLFELVEIPVLKA